MPQYLEASAGTLCSVLSMRGYKIHYVINNSFEPTHVGMAGPLEWFPQWFRAAGFVYICSQEAAIELMKSDNQLAALHLELLPKYIEEARWVVNQVVERCHQGSNHYVFLDTDAEQDTFALVFAAVDSPGVITIARDAPPHTGSKCVLILPPNLRDNPV